VINATVEQNTYFSGRNVGGKRKMSCYPVKPVINSSGVTRDCFDTRELPVYGPLIPLEGRDGTALSLLRRLPPVATRAEV
jgi:hypothetical protein